MMTCLPYAFVVIRNSKRVLLGKFLKPTCSALMFVLSVETVSAVGLSVLVFVVLPALDNVIEVRR